MSRLFAIFIFLGGFFLSLSAQDFNWVTHIPGLSEEIPRDVALGPSGNIYVCGAFGNTMILPNDTLSSESQDAFVMKFDPEGNLLWYTLMTSSFGESAAYIGLDSLERVYVLVETADTLKVQGQTFTDLSEPYLVLQFDSEGNYLSHFEPLADNGQGAGFAWSGMTVSPAGRITLAGSFGVFVQNPQSITLGAQTFDLPADPVNGFRIPQGFVAQYRSDGTVLWAKITNGGGPSSINHFDETPDGGVVVCGTFGPAGMDISPDFDFGLGTPSLNTDFGSAGFIARYDSAGTVLWAQAIQPGPPTQSQFTSVRGLKLAMDATGAVYVYGEYVEKVYWGNDSINAFPAPFFGTVGPWGYLLKASSAGEPLWIKGVSYGDMGSAQVRAIEAKGENVFIGGSYSDTLSIGGDSLMGGVSDIWFASLDSADGHAQYLKAVNAPGFPDEVNALAVRPNGQLLIAGVFDPPAAFGPFSFPVPANTCCSSFFLASFGGDTMATAIRDDFYENSALASPWKAYPNPFKDVITLEFPAKNAASIHLSWHDLQGRKVQETTISKVQEGKISLSTTDLKKGVYVLRMEGEGFYQSWLLRKE